MGNHLTPLAIHYSVMYRNTTFTSSFHLPTTNLVVHNLEIIMPNLSPETWRYISMAVIGVVIVLLVIYGATRKPEKYESSRTFGDKNGGKK